MVSLTGQGSIGLYLFISIVLIWVLGEYIGGILIPHLRRHGAKVKKEDKGSRLLLYLCMYPSFILAFFFEMRGIAILPGWTFYPGLVMMAVGIIIRQWAIAVLGGFFSVDVGTQKGQRVIKEGPYKPIRHPSYAGLFLIIIGFGLAMQSWGAVLILVLLNGCGIGYRIHVEEHVLVSDLGEEYLEYMKRTKRLIPCIL